VPKCRKFPVFFPVSREFGRKVSARLLSLPAFSSYHLIFSILNPDGMGRMDPALILARGIAFSGLPAGSSRGG
jgi:hypothetical protein